MITRRNLLVGASVVALMVAVGGVEALLEAQPAAAQSATAAELLVPPPLGDRALGKEDAPVTIVEYASMTCPHCAHFHETTYPELKKRYIDTNKVRFILREFPLDPLATAGFMLARCDTEAKYYPITDLLFEQQKNWAFSEKPLDALRQLMRQAGFSQEKFEACLQDQKLYDAVNAVKNRGVEMFKVDSTPTFFINGQRHPGSLSIDEIEKIIKPVLGE